MGIFQERILLESKTEWNLILLKIRPHFFLFFWQSDGLNLRKLKREGYNWPLLYMAITVINDSWCCLICFWNSFWLLKLRYCKLHIYIGTMEVINRAQDVLSVCLGTKFYKPWGYILYLHTYIWDTKKGNIRERYCWIVALIWYTCYLKRSFGNSCVQIPIRLPETDFLQNILREYYPADINIWYLATRSFCCLFC